MPPYVSDGEPPSSGPFPGPGGPTVDGPGFPVGPVGPGGPPGSPVGPVGPVLPCMP